MSGPKRPHKVRVLYPKLADGSVPPRPRPTAVGPTCPTWVPAEGKREWKRIIPELAAMGTLADADRASIAAYCAAYARWVAAEKIINQNGVLVEGYRGVTAKNPACQVARDQRAQMLLFARELGLTPKAREHISLHPTEDDVDEGYDDGFFGDRPAQQPRRPS